MKQYPPLLEIFTIFRALEPQCNPKAAIKQYFAKNKTKTINVGNLLHICLTTYQWVGFLSRNDIQDGSFIWKSSIEREDKGQIVKLFSLYRMCHFCRAYFNIVFLDDTVYIFTHVISSFAKLYESVFAIRLNRSEVVNYFAKINAFAGSFLENCKSKQLP